MRVYTLCTSLHYNHLFTLQIAVMNTCITSGERWFSFSQYHDMQMTVCKTSLFLCGFLFFRHRQHLQRVEN